MAKADAQSPAEWSGVRAKVFGGEGPLFFPSRCSHYRTTSPLVTELVGLKSGSIRGRS